MGTKQKKRHTTGTPQKIVKSAMVQVALPSRPILGGFFFIFTVY